MEFIEASPTKMGYFDDNFIDGFFDYGFINHVTSPDFPLSHCSGVNIDFSQTCRVLQEQESPNQYPSLSYNIDIAFSQAGSERGESEFDRELLRKRGRTDTGGKPKTKACRERERREKVNKSFLGLSSILEPGRVVKTDKLDILNDAIRVVNRLRTEAEEYKAENKKLLKKIDSLKEEKNELREEKLTLKTEKEKMEQQLNALPFPSPGLVPSYPPAYHAGINKMDVYPSYGMYPMWHYLPPSTRDTSHDHVLRPPAA